MKSKVLKIGTVLLAFVCLVSFFAFPVSAWSVTDYGFSVTDIKQGWSSVVTSSPNGYYTDTLYIDQADENKDGLHYLSFGQYSGNSSASGYYRPLAFTLTAGGGYSSYTVSIDFVNFYFTNDSESSLTKYLGGKFAYVGSKKQTLKNTTHISTNGDNLTGSQFSFTIQKNQSVQILLCGGYNSSVAAYHQFSIWYSITPNDSTQEVIDNQNENTDKIISAQQEATESQTNEITNGWGGADSVDDGTADNFANAEDAALGGKSDEEIQTEINNALNFDIGVFDTVKVGKIHSLFDNVLNVTGSWQSLFVLSLTLGLGAFLIGRRYG